MDFLWVTTAHPELVVRQAHHERLIYSVHPELVEGGLFAAGRKGLVEADFPSPFFPEHLQDGVTIGFFVADDDLGSVLFYCTHAPLALFQNQLRIEVQDIIRPIIPGQSATGSEIRADPLFCIVNSRLAEGFANVLDDVFPGLPGQA